MATRRHLVAAARGDEPLDILIRDARLVNVLTGTIDHVDIGVTGNRIASVLSAGDYMYHARHTLDVAGRHVTPGFVDGHVHNESSMCTPAQWAKVVVPLGTTTVCTDPHEIANVMGLRGIDYMLRASAQLPLRYYVTASSCVPAVPSIETAGATFTDAEIAELLSWERVVAIAEAMDYPGLIRQQGNITPIVEAGHARDVPIEGHAPTVVGRDLQAYLAAAGPRSSDHESRTADEMEQKVKGGMMAYARRSSFGDLIPEFAEAVRRVRYPGLFGFCTDDILPHDLVRMGHLDAGMRRLIGEGVDPITVIQMATLNVARHYSLHGIGAIAPGWLADILVLDSLEDVRVRDVVVDGRVVVQEGALVVDVPEPVPPLLENSVHLAPLSEDAFHVTLPSSGDVTVHAVDMSSKITTLTEVTVRVDDDRRVQFPLPPGVLAVAIVPRHGQGTPPMVALAARFGLETGAIASTVSHDSHNLAIIGTNPADMLCAARELQRAGGGLVAVRDQKVESLVPLPIAGLMSPLPVEVLAEQLTGFEAALGRLGLPEAFPTALVAMALPVIPEVRLTDLGVVDVATQQFIPPYNRPM